MFPKNPLLQLVPARLPQALQRVRSEVWQTLAEVPKISANEAGPVLRTFEQASGDELKPINKFPIHYGKLWDQRWFRLEIPASRKNLYLRWDDESEATLYVKGLPYYGLDGAHRFAPLPSSVREVWIESIVCRTGVCPADAIGLSPKGSQLDGAVLLIRNDLAWDVLHDFLVLEDLMREELLLAFPGREGEFAAVGTKPGIGQVPPLLRMLWSFLDDAVDALDVGGLPAAKKALSAAFAGLRSHAVGPSAVLTGHAHIDLVWMWPERIGERKAVHSFSTMNRLMDRYPEFRFAYSQPASYEAVERISPKLSQEVRKRISQGRWEAEGATYVESDTLLACGEALVRSFLIGQDGFRAMNGKPSRILWLPDVFGYSGCLPQMMKETGVDYFFTSKLAWNSITPFPHSSFRWMGADGSEVVAFVCQSGGYNQAVSVRELRNGAAAHRQCHIHDEFLAPTGWGDGGGGVSEEMCERARRVADLAGMPPSQWGSISGFFDRLGKIRNRLPAYRGELYFEYHRGTYTTHGDIKAAMRSAEQALQIREAAACATGEGPLDPADWKRVVFAQFHDYIPGSSIHEVYDEAKPELQAIKESNLAAASARLGKGSSPAIFNPLPHPRIHFADGQAYQIPPLTGLPLKALAKVHLEPVVATATALRNGRVDAKFDRWGHITAISVDGTPIALSGPGNELILFPDFPHIFEAWDIDREALSLGKPDHRKAAGRVLTSHPLRSEIVFERLLGKSSHIAVHYILEAGSPVLQMEYHISWHEPNALLKAAFPTRYLGRHARFGTPYGSVRRPQLGGDIQAEAMWEVPGSRWAAVTDDCESAGLFVVTAAKYGFACRDGTLAPSLVRSARITMEERGAVRGTHPESIRRTMSPNVLSDIGNHRITMAIGRFDPAAVREEQPAALAEIQFTPAIEYSGPARDCGFIGIEGGESLQPAWAVPGKQRSWVLRLHETLGRSGSARVLLAENFTAQQVDLSGNPIGPKGTTIEFRAYQIVSLKISRT
jgi:alpha-mannosidase